MLEPPPHSSLPLGTTPIAKVGNPAIVASVATVLAWVAKQYFETEIPADVAIAGVGVVCFLVAYFTPIKRREVQF